MATLIDRKRKTRTDGAPDVLEALMVSALITATKFRCANLPRYCEVSVHSAIRRDGFTDAGQRLALSEAERQEWEATHEIPA